MAEKVNKTYYLFSISIPYKLVCILFVMSPSAEESGSLAVYDFVTQYAIYFMGLGPNPIQFYHHDFRAKIEGQCMFEHSF